MPDKNYIVKIGEEIAWVVITAAGTVIIIAATHFDPSTVTDWRTYAIALGASCVRAAGVAVLGMFGKAAVQK